MPRSIDDLLNLALARGVISADQVSALRDLGGGDAGPGAGEMPRGFNWVTVAYALGALLVVFACGWFLAERWISFGAPGVLAVVCIYAVALFGAMLWFERGAFTEAAGVAAMLVVSLTPVAVWALQSLSQWWPPETWGQPYYPAFPSAESSRWVVAELATIFGALMVLRRRGYVAGGLPVGGWLVGRAVHLRRLGDAELRRLLERWTMWTAAMLLCAIADTVGRRYPRGTATAGAGRGDFAFPLWLAGLLVLAGSLLAFWPTAGVWRHGLPLLSLGVVAASLTMGRRTHLVFGVLGIFMYLVYLSAEVFRSTAYFPIALAALGGAMLLATVWLQRRFPSLAQRLGTAGRAGLPGWGGLPWLVAGLALGITLLRIPEAAEERTKPGVRTGCGSSGAQPIVPTAGGAWFEARGRAGDESAGRARASDGASSRPSAGTARVFPRNPDRAGA